MFCPNAECPDRIADDRPGEYRQEIEICPICGTPLVTSLAEVDGYDELERTVGPPMRDRDGPPDRVVLRTSNIAEADMAASLLEDHGVPFYRRTLALGGLGFGTGTAALGPGGEHLLLAPDGVADQAEQLIDGLFAGLPRVDQVEDRPVSDSPAGMFGRVILVAMLLLTLVVLMRSIL